MLESKSRAKVNLFLHVIDRREDGYHLIESIFAKLKLADRITVEKAEELQCTTQGMVIEHNVALQAAQKLQQFCGKPYGAKITIKKAIPIAAGLGGGSSDAATVLKMLIKLWNISITNDELARIALSLGSDIPFCLQDKTCLVRGIGELLKPIKFGQTLHLLLVHPRIQISSQTLYTRVRARSQSIGATPSKAKLLYLSMHGKNDLTEAAHEIHPDLDLVRSALIAQKDVISVRMSGSGSTYFAIFGSKQSALDALLHLKKSTKTWIIWQESIKI